MLDSLASRAGASLTGAKDKALQAKAAIAGQQVVFAKPTTYMNLSGEAVGKIMRYYKVWPGMHASCSHVLSLWQSSSQLLYSLYTNLPDIECNLPVDLSALTALHAMRVIYSVPCHACLFCDAACEQMFAYLPDQSIARLLNGADSHTAGAGDLR